MATVALQPLCRAPTPPPVNLSEETILGSAMHPPSTNGGQFTNPVTIPNKHFSSAAPSPGPPGQTPPVTPPDSPQFSNSTQCMPSRLYPPDDYRLISEAPPVRAVDAATVAAAINHTATQPLPSPDEVFPWAHGLHPDNHIQLTFFYARKKSTRKVPTCFRCITIVKVGGDLNSSKLKGAVLPDDILPKDDQPGFLNLDPRDGFCVRNFQIQVGKFATVSDIIVYGDDNTRKEEINEVAERISAAQLYFRSRASRDFPIYSTFVVQGQYKFYPGCLSA